MGHGQGLPPNHSTDAAADDFVALRLQCRLPWLLPLLDQAVVSVEACLVLPAHGPRLPNNSTPLKRVGGCDADIEVVSADVVHASVAGQSLSAPFSSACCCIWLSAMYQLRLLSIIVSGRLSCPSNGF